MKLVTQLSCYFSDEIDEIKDGISIKTATTKQLVKKFLPFNQISKLEFFLPYYKSRYTLYFDYLLDYAKTRLVLTFFTRTIESNIEDDFSSSLPIIKEIIAAKIIKSYKKNDDAVFNSLATNVCALFISPPTRHKIMSSFIRRIITF